MGGRRSSLASRSMANPSSSSGLGRSSNRWASLATLADSKIACQMQDEEVDDQVDRLTNLPDDILLNIVERLDTACTTRTSILSRRWRQIPAMLSNIGITVGSYDPELDRSKLTYGDVSRANAAVHEATRSILGIRTASLHPIRLLCMQFFLGDGSLAIGQAVAGAIAATVVESAELTLLTHQEGRRCTDDDLLSYGLQFRSFLYACPSIFSGLTRLKLENLGLGLSDFSQVFSLSKRLEFLRLFNCDAGILSVLQVEHQQLRELEIFRCDLERVDLNWVPNLTKLTFSCWTSRHDPLSFGYVPLLQAVTLSNTAVSWHKMLKLSEFLGNATISELHLNFESEKIWVKPEGPRELSKVFHKLRLVNLADISEECDLAWTLFVLQGAPSLKELCLTVWNRCEMTWDEEERKKCEFSEEKKDAGLEWETSASYFKHHNLAVLRIFGFQFEEKFVNYVQCVMESAVNLKDIYLYERPICETCRNKTRKDRYPWAKKQRTSLINSLDMDTLPLLRIHFPSLRT